MANTYDPISTPGLLEPLRRTQPSEGYLVGKNPLIIGGKKWLRRELCQSHRSRPFAKIVSIVRVEAKVKPEDA